MSGEQQRGFIHIFRGPMFSGKTTEMVRQIAMYRQAKKRTCIYKWAGDTRYAPKELVSSHENSLGIRIQVPGIPTRSLILHRYEMIENFDVIGVEEAQFFSGAGQLILDLVLNHNKIFFISMLSGTFQQKPWPAKAGEELSLYDELREYSIQTSLSGICDICSSMDATCSYRKTQETDVEVVGDAEKYGVACLHCVHKLNPVV